MNLHSLLSCLQDYEISTPLPDIDISGLAYDSREVEKGYLFVALPGIRHHGLDFLAEAENRGAAAVLSDRPASTPLPFIRIPQPRLALALLSNTFYSYPSKEFKLFAVTGTNGKTTSTFLLQSVLEENSMKSGLLGTIQYQGAGFKIPSILTTPESLDLQKLLRTMVRENCKACVMEVSSHSLVQHRVTGCSFEAAIFTNLTRDHLDYHHGMEEYFAAKKMLFDETVCRTQNAILNMDDPYGQKLIQERKRINKTFFTFGFSSEADFCITEWNTSPTGSFLKIRYQSREISLRTILLARYNAYNIGGVFAAACTSGIPEESIVRGIEKMKQVPGRLEKIDCGQPFLVLIDYAHTEDALRQLLNTVRPYTPGRLLVLFGCGGDRDKGKRPLMGKAAGELADVIFLTSDNPRFEDPERIIQEILEGVQITGNSNVHVFPDREEAIVQALRMAQPGDTLVLAGKGHEDYQIIGDQKLHFDEREIVRKYLNRCE